MAIQQLGGFGRSCAGLRRLLAALCPAGNTLRNPLDLSTLEDRTLYSATPVMLNEVQVDTSEDAPQISLDLRSRFSLDNSGTMQLSVAQNDHPGLFDSLSFGTQQQLLIDLAHNANGTADLVIRATNSVGAIELLPVHIDITSINDSPTAIDLQSVTVTDLSAGQTVIDLFAAFDDVEDADEDLTYRIASNTRPDLFSSIEFDLDHGKLILHHAAGKTGSAELTIEATDTGNLSVGLGTSPDFKVYNRVLTLGEQLDIESIGLSEMQLWTHWYFFDLGANGYDFSHTNIEKLTGYLQSLPTTATDVPIVFNIENDEFVNTAAGRDRFAEVFALAQEIRPDINFSLYRYMPERTWSEPLNYFRALEHQAMGLNDWYVANMDTFEQAYNDWLDRNELYRTEAVSSEFGGVPLGDLVDSIQASLYTRYRNDPTEPHWRAAEFSGLTDTFTVDGPSYDTVDIVRIELTANGSLPSGMAKWTDYYVTNVNGKSFQLAATPGGPAIDFGNTFAGTIYVGAKGPVWENLWHDPSVIDWQIYAEQNIAEARKFDKPVTAWIAPSFKGVGSEFLEPDFFRYQLEVLRPIVDGIAIYDSTTRTADFHENQGWWTALSDFMATLDDPAATVTISIPSGSAAASNSSGSLTTTPPPSVTTAVAFGDQFTMSQGHSVTFQPGTLLLNDQAHGATSLRAVLASRPAHGTLSLLNDGQWQYTPDANYHGTDSFTYRAFNGNNYSNAGVVTLKIQATDVTPVPVNDLYTINEDQTLRMSISSLLANDHDVDTTHPKFQLVSKTQHGSLSQNANGALVYRPHENFSGSDHFTYQLREADGTLSSVATVTLNVNATNDRPIAVADKFRTEQGQTLQFAASDLLRNDVDAEQDSLTAEIVKGPANGKLRMAANGTYEYIPNARFQGTDEIVYRVSDGRLDSLVTTVAIEVTPRVLDAVVANDSFATLEDKPLVLETSQLLSNVEGLDLNQVTFEFLDTPEHGTVRRAANGSIVYTPAADFNGVDRFGYRVSANGASSELIAVQVHVSPVNDAPDAIADVYRIRSGASLSVGGSGVLSNDTDPDGDHLRARLLRGPSSGKLVLLADGSFDYRPNVGFVGTDSFQYRVIDDSGASAVARAIVRVEAAPNNAKPRTLAATSILQMRLLDSPLPTAFVV